MLYDKKKILGLVKFYKWVGLHKRVFEIKMLRVLLKEYLDAFLWQKENSGFGEVL
jgi:hypothetical protein